MNILMVSHEYPPVGGGGANACMSLAKEFANNEHTVDIVTVWYKGQNEIEKQGNISIYRLKSKRQHKEHCTFSEMLDYLIKAYPEVDKIVRSKKYDICQVFFGIPSGPIGYHLKRKYNIPYVIRFGGGDIPGFQDRFSKVYKIIGPAIKQIWKNADALVANSEGLKSLAEEFYDKREISIIPNGADAHRFTSDEKVKVSYDEGIEKQDGVIDVLFVSRLIERKGLQDIIPQMSFIEKKCAEAGKKIKFHVVGDGPYRKHLEELVNKENKDSVVIFYGQKDKKKLPGYYRNADLFIFPSRKEGMPNVVLEAMSYGLPIIMTPCQGSYELIDGNGAVTDVKDFGSKVINLVINDDLRCEYGKKSLALISDRLNWKNTANKYLELFERIVEKQADR